MRTDKPPQPDAEIPQPLLNIAGLLIGGATIFATPFIGVEPAFDALIILLVPVTLGIAWLWPGWSSTKKEFILMTLLGVAVGWGFIGTLAYCDGAFAVNG
jgi:hypothetical protein